MTPPNKKNLGLVALLIGGLTVSAMGVASANPRIGDDREAWRIKMMKQADANHDGKLDDAERQVMRTAKKAEHAARKKEILNKYDANRDGRLDDAERAVFATARAAERFAQLDKNRDGKLTPAEFQAGKRGFGRGHRGRGARRGGGGMERTR